MDCADIEVTYGKLKNGVPYDDRQKLKTVGITDDNGICAFKIQGATDCEMTVEDWCYSIEKKKLNFHEAAESCEKKGQSLAVLHNDNDVQRLLKATSGLKSSHFWIGAATVDSAWQFHDNTAIDFFRFKPLERFTGNELGLLFQSRSENDSYNGYSGVSDVNNEFPFICSQKLDNDYRSPFKLNRFPKPQTMTTAKPTTRYPRIEKPKEWITDAAKGQQIYREIISPGYVVSEERFPQIEETCPELMKVGIWRRATISYIGNNPPANFVLSESFYCSPRQFYCGANFLLRRLDRIKGGDIAYFSEDEEAYKRLSSHDTAPATYRHPRGGFLETPCWVWKNYTDTNSTMVRAGGGMLWTRYNTIPNKQWSYGLDIYEVPLQDPGNTIAGPGYVILEEAYEAYFKEACPELISMRVWHGSNGGREYNTWFGRDGEPPASHINTKVYQEARKFYCAPRKGYCGADFLLRRSDRTDLVKGYNPQSWYPESDAREKKVTGWRRVQEVCYVWKTWQ